MADRRVKLFRNGRDQAVRVPREYELQEDEAILHRDGDRLILEPASPQSLLAVLAGLGPITEDFSPIADPPPERVKP